MDNGGMDEACLEIQGDAGEHVVSLEGQRLTLGRESTNIVPFPTDETVSSNHAALERVPNGWCLSDLGSLNGTYVNGTKLVVQHVLRPGDVITIGGNRIVFRVGAGESRVDLTSSQWTVSTDGAVAQALHVEQSQFPAAEATGYLDPGEEWHADAVGAERMPPPHGSTTDSGGSTEAPPLSDDDRRDGGLGRVRGIARSIEIRKIQNSRDTLVFRVDSYDESGRRVDPVAVELWLHRTGQVSEGEEVEVIGKWSHGTLRADRIVNLSTNAEVQGGLSRAEKRIQRFVLAFAALIFSWVFIVFFVVLGVFGVFGGIGFAVLHFWHEIASFVHEAIDQVTNVQGSENSSVVFDGVSKP